MERDEHIAHGELGIKTGLSRNSILVLHVAEGAIGKKFVKNKNEKLAWYEYTAQRVSERTCAHEQEPVVASDKDE